MERLIEHPLYAPSYLPLGFQDPSKKHRFDLLLEEYREQLEKKRKPTTVCLHYTTLVSGFLPYFEGRCAEDIDNEDLTRFNDEMNAKLSPGALRNLIQASRLFVRYCRKHNPFLDESELFIFANSKPDTREAKMYTPSEEKRIIEAAKGKPLDELMLRLLCYYGLRCGELVGLQRGDFDFEHMTLTIRRTIATKTLRDGRIPLCPKTKRSHRTLILLPGLKELIPEGLSDTDWIFPTTDGKKNPLFEATVRSRARRYAEKAGLHKIKIHEFRHSCASNLLRSGIPLRVVARWIGDKEATILQYYSHMFMDEVACVPKLLIEQFDLPDDPALVLRNGIKY